MLSRTREPCTKVKLHRGCSRSPCQARPALPQHILQKQGSRTASEATLALMPSREQDAGASTP